MDANWAFWFPDAAAGWLRAWAGVGTLCLPVAGPSTFRSGPQLDPAPPLPLPRSGSPV